MSSILRFIVVALTCLAVVSPLQAADQWDDLAQKFIDQEHARFERRAADNDGIVIVLQHPLISERVVLVVAESKPAMSFQFNSAAVPGDDVFELMARGGHLVTGREVDAVLRGLRQAYADASKQNLGIAQSISDGLTVTCIALRGENTLSFLVAAN